MACILVVEDEPLVRLNLVESLRMKKYEVYGARDGHTAIDFMDAKDFDAVISDYRMPGTVSGLDVLTHFQLRSPGKVKVLITGYGDEHTRKQVAVLGGTYFAKPFVPEELIDVVDRLLTH